MITNRNVSDNGKSRNQKPFHFLPFVLTSLPGTDCVSEPNLDPHTRTKSPAPELTASEPPAPPCKPDKQRAETETLAETEGAADENVAAEPVLDQQAGVEEEEVKEEGVGEVAGGETVVAEVVQPDVEMDVEEEECEMEQTVERDVEDGALLSEKERQNEEVNEKDNCSASSISSASSTLEREEREEKLTNDIEAGMISLKD